MKALILSGYGINCEDETVNAFKTVGIKGIIVHVNDLIENPKKIKNFQILAIPGGFSYGDYLRCGAIGSHSPIMKEIKKRSQNGTKIIGICNGFQILTESKMLPGSLLQNENLKFICKKIFLKVKNNNNAAAIPIVAPTSALALKLVNTFSA